MEQLRGFENKVGIPYKDILLGGYTNGQLQECRGTSGRKLLYELSPQKVSIYDARYPILLLEAERNHSTLQYNLRTRAPLGSVIRRDYWAVNAKGGHPDMNAKHFVFWSLNYFQEVVGVPITTIDARWYDISDNYEQFMTVYDATQNAKTAASQTWSGRTFAQADFVLQSVNPRARDREGEIHISARFARK